MVEEVGPAAGVLDLRRPAPAASLGTPSFGPRTTQILMRGKVTARKRTPADWGVIRLDYEGEGQTIREIAAHHHVSTRSLYKHAAEEGWRRRNAHRQVDRSAIITRMFRVLERQIISLDNNMKQTGEKEVAVLGKLASTLEKLIDIDNAAAPPNPVVQQHDMKELRHKLARRIAQLKAG